MDEFLAETPFCKEEIHAVLDRLGDYQTWPFLCEVEHEFADGGHLHQMDLYEQWCEDLSNLARPWERKLPCPRVRLQERIVLHAYSGRRRPGDFQWFFDSIATSGYLVLSIDIVIDERWGDIGNKDTQHFWLQAIRDGYVIAMLSGPPCCTWSVARGKPTKQFQAQGRPGPRVIRTRQELWGMISVSLREMSHS